MRRFTYILAFVLVLLMTCCGYAAEQPEMGQLCLQSEVVPGDEYVAGNFSDVGFEDSCWSVNEPAHMSEWQYPADTYDENVELLRTWLIKRATYLDTQFGIFIFTPALAVQ